MNLSRWSRIYFDSDGGSSSGSSATSGGSATAAPAGGGSSPGETTPATPANTTSARSNTRNGIVSSSPSPVEGEETPVETLKAQVKAHVKKQREANAVQTPAGNQATGVPPSAKIENTAPAPAQPAAPAFTTQHYETGKALGLDKPQVDSFGGPAQFDAFVNNVRQNYQRAVQQQAQQLAQQQLARMQSQQPQPGGSPAPAANGAPNAVAQTPFGAFNLEDPNEELDPRIHQIVKHHNEVVSQLHQQLQQLQPFAQQFQQVAPILTNFQTWQAQEQQRQQVETWKQADTAMEKIDPELFGEGDRKAWTPNHLNARIQLADDVSRLEGMYRSRGEALPPIAELVEAAYRMRHHDRIEKQVLAKAAKQSREVRGQATAVPTAREHRPLTSEERARKVVADKLREQAREAGEPEPVFAM